ncbi:hypothetical protein GLOIN_2v1811937 [Rhizophagus clarus]|uniref:Transposase domain-containing protein n=1 Tax=Rhizophagus clarus TaxID=94130 RepID=A0A8H3QZZ1_9GLOM|nr:hypothetical protein GLOIN_2v1811937 [Rhizophagus clarus]
MYQYQQQLNFTPISPTSLQVFDNNHIWDEIKDFGNFLQASNINNIQNNGNKQILEQENYNEIDDKYAIDSDKNKDDGNDEAKDDKDADETEDNDEEVVESDKDTDEAEHHDDNEVEGDNDDDDDRVEEIEIDEFTWLKDSKSNCSENSSESSKGLCGMRLADAYEDLNSRMYIDQMDIKDFNIKTKHLCEFEGKFYRFQYRPIFDAIKSLVSNPGLRNIPNWRQNFPDAKVFIGFLPHLTTRNNKLRDSKEFRQMQRKVEQCALKILLKPLLQNNGIYLRINETVEYFTPYLSIILADMLEAQNICCTYKLYRTKCSCYKCLTPSNQLNNMFIKQNLIVLRTHENMHKAVFSHNATEFSIHEYEIFFWKLRMTNIYDAVTMDRMHLQEIGLFPAYMLNFT